MENNVVFEALDGFAIELPSWGFANTGTRFGKFIQDAAATTTEEKFADAGQVHAFTGCCPTVAIHVKWDYPCDKSMAAKYGVAIGSVNPNLFEDQIYQARIARQSRRRGARRGVAASDRLRGNCETNPKPRSVAVVRRRLEFPGHRQYPPPPPWFEEGLKAMHARLSPDQRMLWNINRLSPRFTTPISPIGACLCCWRGPPGRRLGFWSTLGITIRLKTLNKSYPGCLPRTCLADFTSTTAAMPTTI